MAHNTSSEYKQVIYSGDARHKIKIIFNGNELLDADRYCEKITRTARIIPDDGSKRFSLDNFMSQELELILHDVDTSLIEDQVEISIGTLVNNEYEYVPLGIFNIQDVPKTDKNKITIKLRDNRVKFDFGYNAQPLIEQNGGKATKRQVLDDICNQAGVVNKVSEFLGQNDEIAIYDSTIKGTMYIIYIASQAGAIPIIDRDGGLIFVYLDNLNTIKIPLYILEKYELGTPYTISRIVYEDGIRKFETSNDESLSTLYLDSSNPYIDKQEQIDNIYNILNGFTIDSVKTGKIYGDPAIDPYDIIEVYGYYEELPNGNKHFIADENTIVFRTLANHTMTYTGKIISVYDTQIGIEQRNENVSLVGEDNFKKFAKTSINNIENTINLIVGEQNGQKEQLSQLQIDINSIQNLFQITGGSNLIKNSQFLLTDDVWEITKEQDGYCTSLGAGYNANLIGKTTAVANIVIKNAKIETKISNISNLKIGQSYTLHFYYTLDSDTTARVKLMGRNNGKTVYDRQYTTNEELKEIIVKFTATDTEYTLSFESHTEVDGALYIYDLMLNSGDVKTWEPAMSEVYSTVLKMSQLGLQVYASGSNTITLLTSMGFKIYKSNNGEIGAVVTEFTDTGIITNEIIAKKKIQNGSWIEKDVIISYTKHHIEYMESD